MAISNSHERCNKTFLYVATTARANLEFDKLLWVMTVAPIRQSPRRYVGGEFHQGESSHSRRFERFMGPELLKTCGACRTCQKKTPRPIMVLNMQSVGPLVAVRRAI